MSIEDHVAENYEALIADENRNLTYDGVAELADRQNDANLAAWARAKAAGQDVDVTPSVASYEPPKKVTRRVKKDDETFEDVDSDIQGDSEPDSPEPEAAE